jgi:putative DNA primase/helicase
MHLATSGMASLDVDWLEPARPVLAAEGISIDDFVRRYPTIRGRGLRLEFMAPPGVPFESHKLNWPRQDNPRKQRCVLELRAGSANLQDVLPPSWHPEARRPYQWLTPPGEAFPMLPDELLRLWLEWPAFEARAKALCPWAPPPVAEPERPSGARPRTYTGPSVAQAWNDAHDLPKMLANYGYKRVGDSNRWLSPDSTSGRAGLLLLAGAEHARVLCMSGSGPLADGKPHDAFDLLRLHEHEGDRAKAVKAAAKALGMDAESRRAHRVPELARLPWHDYLAIRTQEADALHMYPGALDVAVRKAQRESSPSSSIDADSTGGCTAELSKV